jgi:hypothetical protein
MKKKFFFLPLLLLLGFQSLRAQIWNTYDVDSIVRVRMPWVVYELDTMLKEKHLYQIYSEDSSTTYIVKKLFDINKIVLDRSIPAPVDEKSLKKFYQSMAFVAAETRYQETSISRPIYKQSLMGYRFTLEKNKDYPYNETQLFFVNNQLYTFQYNQNIKMDSLDRSFFFDSIQFSDQYELKQFNEKSSFFDSTYVIIIGIILLISFAARWIPKLKKDTN